VLLATISVARSDDGHDHDSLEQRKHVHGAATFNVALEGRRLVVELDAPADNVVGFEKSPRNETERKAIETANAWLASGRNIVAVPRPAGCRLQAVDFTPPTFGKGHADYRARFNFECANPGAIEWVELWALRRLLEVEKAEVNVITATVQRQVDLTAGNLRVSLK
jgi:hypothetical protein